MASLNETEWSTIVSAIDNAASGATCGFSLGDTKTVNFGYPVGIVDMELIAFDTDILTDGTRAKTTWLAKNLRGRAAYNSRPGSTFTLMSGLATQTTNYACGSGSAGGWLYTTLREDLERCFLWLPSALQNGIKEVKKVAKGPNPNLSATIIDFESTDKLWAPSREEMLIKTADPTYTGYFTDNSSRIKYIGEGTTAGMYWLRGNSGSSYASGNTITTSGSYSAYTATYSYYVCPGFCI